LTLRLPFLPLHKLIVMEQTSKEPQGREKEIAWKIKVET
jgi:hypothetical protein